MTIPRIRVRQKVWRIIPSRFPPIDVFEQVADAEDFALLHELEMRTNPRLRDEIGDIVLVPPEDRVYGPGAGYIMAAFTHLNPEDSRFSNGSYGVFYAGKTVDTAIHETRFHRTQFLLHTQQPAQELDMRVLCAKLSAEMHTIAGMKESMPEIYAVDSYTHSQEMAKQLRDQGSNGIVYDSVRHEGGTCYAVLRPKALSECTQAQHLCYVWNGQAIEHVYEKKMIF